MVGNCSSSAWQNFWDQIVFLLLLLPPSCHPAVLQARLPDIQRRRTLPIPVLPEHPGMDDASPARASLSVQVLSAAAVLAGGQPHRVWDPEVDPAMPPHLQLSAIGFPIDDANPRKRRRESQKPSSGVSGQPCDDAGGPGLTTPLPVAPVDFAPASTLDAAAALTRLEVTLHSFGSHAHLLRSYSALAQLKTLRELRIDSPLTSAACPLVESTLQALPALVQFHIWVNCGGVSFADVGRLIRSISALPNLVDVSLENCFQGARGYGRPDSESPQQEREAALTLSCLTNLTRLSLGANQMRQGRARVFAEALGALSGLQELSVWATSEFSHEHEWLESRGMDADRWDMLSGGGYNGSEAGVSDFESELDVEVHLSDASLVSESDDADSDGMGEGTQGPNSNAVVQQQGTGVGRWEPAIDLARSSGDSDEGDSDGAASGDGAACSDPIARPAPSRNRSGTGAGGSVPFRGPLVLHVCRCTTLPALRALDAGETYTARPTDYVRCLEAGGGGVLRQLTALDLRHCCYGRSDAAALRTLLARLTGLHSLNLAGNEFRDVGLGAVAEALPGLTALTCLDVSETESTSAGVRQVVEAAQKLLVGGEGGLRRLAIAEICLRDDGAIAERLGRLVGLEELVLSETEMPIAGVSAVLVALPRLRVLDISLCRLAASDAAVFAQAACLQRLEIESAEERHRYEPKDGDVGFVDRGGDAVKEAVLAAAPWLTVVARSTWRAECLLLF